MFESIPGPQYLCSPGSYKFITATTPFYRNWSIMENYSINLSESLYDPINKSSTHSECRPKIAGG